MSGMFGECSNLTNINLFSFNTQNVTNMSAMFSDCIRLSKLDLSSFNTKNVTNMSDMFYYCKELKNIDLSSFNRQKVNDIADKYNKYRNIFTGCSRLERVILNFEESKIKKLIESDKIIYS